MKDGKSMNSKDSIGQTDDLYQVPGIRILPFGARSIHYPDPTVGIWQMGYELEPPSNLYYPMIGRLSAIELRRLKFELL